MPRIEKLSKILENRAKLNRAKNNKNKILAKPSTKNRNKFSSRIVLKKLVKKHLENKVNNRNKLLTKYFEKVKSLHNTENNVKNKRLAVLLEKRAKQNRPKKINVKGLPNPILFSRRFQ